MLEVPKQQEVNTTATAVAADVEEKEVPVPKQEDTTATDVAAAEVPKQEDTTSIVNLCVEYNSGDDVEDDNKDSFIEKEARKIREKGKAAYFRRGMFRCPYCTTKPKPRDGIYEHLMSHARGLSWSADQDIKTRAEHAALLKALGPI
ncbi:lrr receptor-like serine threonine-protein kinase [Hordeum vulgare]|nr:lrr receptor-like serine threonine-protein kinase [Hordeum vulgare]